MPSTFPGPGYLFISFYFWRLRSQANTVGPETEVGKPTNMTKYMFFCNQGSQDLFLGISPKNSITLNMLVPHGRRCSLLNGVTPLREHLNPLQNWWRIVPGFSNRMQQAVEIFQYFTKYSSAVVCCLAPVRQPNYQNLLALMSPGRTNINSFFLPDHGGRKSSNIGKQVEAL